MRDYIIMTDSTTDLPNDFVNKNNIVVLPMTFSLDGKDYKNYPDNRELSPKDFYDLMRDGKQPITAQVNSEEFITIAEPILKDKDILYICFSSALSGTYNSVRLGAEDLKEKYPDSNIKLVDSKLASMGEGLLVYYANKFKQEGQTLEENYNSCESKKKEVISWFTVSDIETLRRGGRVSNVAAFLAKALKIKPILHVSEDGKLMAMDKVRGRKASLKTLIDEMEARVLVDRNDVVFISHGDCIDDANYVKELITEKFGITNFMINEIGPVIGAHSGPDTIALFYVGSKK